MVDDKFVDSTATQIYEESDGEDETASVGNTMKTQSFHQGDSAEGPSGQEDPAPAPASSDESGPSAPPAKRPRLGDAWTFAAVDHVGQLQLEANAGAHGPVFN